MKKKKRKFKIKKIILFIIFIAIIKHIHDSNIIQKNINSISVTSILETSNYKTIKQDTNNNYNGLGQEKIKGKDGYFTTFTTGDKNKKIYIEYKQNGDSSWATKEYWGGTMQDNGCGITTLSIILSGYGEKYTPDDLRKKYSPMLNYENFSKELSQTYNIKNSDFYYDSIHLSEEKLEEHLLKNKPIVICVWNKPHENRWTSKSHYMALLATDGKGMVYISNPNGGINDSKSSGWYEFKEIIPYIAKALYIEKN